MTHADIKDIVFAVLAILVLALFIWIYATELWSAFFRKPLAGPRISEIEDPWSYMTTTVAALVGGVAAVFLGVERAGEGFAPSAWDTSDWIRVAYVIIYVLFGALAIVAWIRLKEITALALRNLAVTFVGLVTPAVAAYLGAASG